MSEPASREVRERIDGLLGTRTVEYVAVSGGYSPAARWRVLTRTGDRVFAKLARNDHTARALRREAEVLRTFDADFAPRMIAFDDHPEAPLLVLEDLGEARWPPPWDDALVERVSDALRRLHAFTTELPPFSVVHAGEELGWRAVAEDPAAFLDLGLADAAWLEAALPALVDAEAGARLDGASLTHFDVRSDNLCLADRGVVLIDWNHACAGQSAMDLGFWLPSLELEGGPPPERLLGDRPDVAAWVSGFFAARAGLPTIPSAPGVRGIQLAQLETALPWAVRALGLADPGAPLSPVTTSARRRVRSRRSPA